MLILVQKQISSCFYSIFYRTAGTNTCFLVWKNLARAIFNFFLWSNGNKQMFLKRYTEYDNKYSITQLNLSVTQPKRKYAGNLIWFSFLKIQKCKQKKIVGKIDNKICFQYFDIHHVKRVMFFCFHFLTIYFILTMNNSEVI